ncbi:MAG: hypothetical protein ACREON_02945 [Gemmatimonadaceae bacterium]
MSAFAELLRAIGALLWPIVTLIGLLLFRNDLRAVLGRLRKGKLLGQEVELDRSIAAFHDIVATASSAPTEPLETPAGSAPKRLAHGAGNTRADGSGADDIQEIIALSSRAPRSALLRLSEALERDIRVFAHATSAPLRAEFISPREAAGLLVRAGVLPAPVGESLAQFWDLRNTVIHGAEASESDLFRLIDSGLELLRTVRRIPAEVITVLDPGFPVYHDEGCTQEFVNIKGISLLYHAPGMEMVRIWGVAKDRTFTRGTHVTKEWDCDRKHGPAWYIDSASSARKQAWTGICEFVGKPIAGL